MEFESSRLRFGKLTHNDAPFLIALLNSEGWLNNIGDRQVRTEEEARRYLSERIFPHYSTQIGPLIIRLHETGTPIGTIGVHVREALPCPDIGYALLPEYWKQGYALEACRAIIAFATPLLELKELCGMVLPENLPSVNLLKKLGLRFEKEFYYPNDPELLHLYRGKIPLDQ